ncbi:MAG: protein translocase subunit SecF [Alphaproteobacteria bacterium]|nr:protein translocase subunit SecF [Alphaproteobacteria bacterium]
MPFLKLVKTGTDIKFMKIKRLTLLISSFLFLLSLISIFTKGLNLGIDFTGGSLIEVRFEEKISLNNLRSEMNNLDLGEIQLQTIGEENDVVIRVQDKNNDAITQTKTIEVIKNSLKDKSVDYRRTEFVGPKVGGELVNAGIIAVIFSLIGILFYIWLRFQWNFAIGAIIALIHDVILTLGFFSVLQLEFNLATVAAVLTIAGYSINDTVVIYDRIRETMRKYKQITFDEIINLALNGTLSRTLMTSLTTLLALTALFIFGGVVISSFIIALIWGVFIGTYSSLYVASPLLIFLKTDKRVSEQD